MSRIKLKYYVDFNLDLSSLKSTLNSKCRGLKLVGRDSNRSTGPALNPMACVDNLVKLYFRIGFNNKEILAVLGQSQCGD